MYVTCVREVIKRVKKRFWALSMMLVSVASSGPNIYSLYSMFLVYWFLNSSVDVFFDVWESGTMILFLEILNCWSLIDETKSQTNWVDALMFECLTGCLWSRAKELTRDLSTALGLGFAGGADARAEARHAEEDLPPQEPPRQHLQLPRARGRLGRQGGGDADRALAALGVVVREHTFVSAFGWVSAFRALRLKSRAETFD